MISPKDYYKTNNGKQNISNIAYQKFFEKYIKKNQDMFFLELHEGEKLNNDAKVFWVPGRCYTYEYDPLYKDALDFYDKRPIIFCLKTYHCENTGNDLVVGLNLNFLPPQIRVTVLEFYWNSFKKEIETAEKSYWEDKIFYTVSKIIEFLKDWVLQVKIFTQRNQNLNFAFRQYIQTRIKNPVLIEYNDWSELLPFLNSKDIEGLGLPEIYNKYFESLDKLKNKKKEKRKKKKR